MTPMMLRIYTDDGAHFGDRQAWREIVRRAQSEGLKGATVIRAALGFGRNARLHSPQFVDDDDSIVVEIVDDGDVLRAFAAGLGDLPVSLKTLNAVEVLA